MFFNEITFSLISEHIRTRNLYSSRYWTDKNKLKSEQKIEKNRSPAMITYWNKNKNSWTEPSDASWNRDCKSWLRGEEVANSIQTEDCLRLDWLELQLRPEHDK